ncbi:MAG: tetratricopeptide repeat protein [Candidatus Nitricoxidivorans perseverans]|uniref:Ancillary SecYEG translocon subunit n=1 Tax=Candidatus Nitricoxidivorans perseverans TaxID=2975601 RepID=A0AA49J154_9PROT|nr:MAG: tetratricopeptide repeat protein [Candidatus Nitricoxidivorans perseverans]
MATYDLEEQEQLDELKTWWKMHGNRVTAVVVALSVAMVGWQGWTWWQKSQAAEASALYVALQQTASQRDAKHSRELAGELIEKFPRTAYAGMAALLSAKIQVEGGDVKTGCAHLAWAVENANDAAVRDLARLRLATVLLDEKAYDEAMKALSPESSAPFAPRYGELKGDILAAQGKMAEARGAYEVALAKLAAAEKADGGRHGAYREVLQTKLDGLGSVGGGK